jgi:hypothetical protein
MGKWATVASFYSGVHGTHSDPSTQAIAVASMRMGPLPNWPGGGHIQDQDN